MSRFYDYDPASLRIRFRDMEFRPYARKDRVIEARLVRHGLVIYRQWVDKPPPPTIACRPPMPPPTAKMLAAGLEPVDLVIPREELFDLLGVEVDRSGTWARYEPRR